VPANLTPQDNYTFAGSVRFRGSVAFPDAAIDPSALAGEIPASKLDGEYSLTLSQTGTIAAATQYLKAIHGTAGAVVALDAAITETLPSGDHTVTIDLQKSTGAGAFATILSATLVFNSSSTLRTVVAGSIASADLVAGDLLKLTVAVAGSTGAQGAGLIVTVTINEDPS
jgi:hypothetical protein